MAIPTAAWAAPAVVLGLLTNPDAGNVADVVDHSTGQLHPLSTHTSPSGSPPLVLDQCIQAPRLPSAHGPHPARQGMVTFFSPDLCPPASPTWHFALNPHSRTNRRPQPMPAAEGLSDAAGVRRDPDRAAYEPPDSALTRHTPSPVITLAAGRPPAPAGIPSSSSSARLPPLAYLPDSRSFARPPLQPVCGDTLRRPPSPFRGPLLRPPIQFPSPHEDTGQLGRYTPVKATSASPPDWQVLRPAAWQSTSPTAPPWPQEHSLVTTRPNRRQLQLSHFFPL